MDHNKRIFALGFFDGVHLGHQALLAECVRMARAMDVETAAITFERHPQSLFRADVPPLLSTLQDRFRLLLRYGVEHVCPFPVTAEVMGKPWQEFLEELLLCGAAGFVCGDDFRFGSRGEGNAQKLQQFCDDLGLPCIIVPEQTLEGVRVSSTHIRRLLEQGDVEQAAAFLGHPHILTGEVVSGRSLGRTLGTPTANLRIPDGVICPRHGVYACRALVDGQEFAAVTNIGTRPTVSGTHVTVEPWLLDFNGDLYGRELTLQFYKFLRPERKFDSLEALRAEVKNNADQTRAYFSNHGKNGKKL